MRNHGTDRPGTRRIAATIAALGLACTTGLPAQHHPEAATPTTARPTHAPQPFLPPLAAWQHVAFSNRTAVAARTAGRALSEPGPRPAGAGRWVCAVVTCADAEVDLAPLLGLARKDVLELRAPGPFLTPDTVALLERAVAQHRLSLVILLAHDDCLSLATGADTPDDPLAARARALVQAAARAGRSVAEEVVRTQREQLLAASDALQHAVAKDRLRVMPAVLAERTGAIRWRHQRADELPLAPVR